MKSLCFSLAWVMCLFLPPALAVNGEPPAASRPAVAGCEWKPFESKALGIRLLREECQAPDMRYVFSVVKNRIEQHRPADDRIFGSHVVLEVFRKKPEQDIKQAIAEQFIAKLPPEARASCKVKVLDRPRLGTGKVVLTLMPTGRYAEKIAAELKEYPRDFGCGDYGRTQGTTYFEYHPDESRARFAFVVYGMDVPLFDDNSIQFLPDARR
jgi:hypothetical protein